MFKKNCPANIMLIIPRTRRKVSKAPTDLVSVRVIIAPTTPMVTNKPNTAIETLILLFMRFSTHLGVFRR